MRVQIANSQALGHRQITGISGVKTLADGVDFAGAATTPIPTGAQYAVIQVTGAAVRWSDDGQTPTATKGHRIADGGELVYGGNALTALKFIQEAATGVVNVGYYKDAR